MTECIFCRIAAGDVRAELVYEDDDLIAFRDINPQAPVHLLVVPREHVSSLSDLGEEHRQLGSRLLLAVPRVAESVDGLEQGYRVIINNGPGGGQTVPHLHLHLLGGRRFGEGMVPG